ncbi:MAG: hypothetical protein J0L69_13310 [Bacteroidetes bacterium]|nr:hypothetical protein [Bacteroidota bacterium]
MVKKTKPKTDSVGYTCAEKELFKKLGKDNVLIEIKAKVNDKMKVIQAIEFRFDKTWQIGRRPNELNLSQAKENSRIYKNVKKYFRTNKA